MIFSSLAYNWPVQVMTMSTLRITSFNFTTAKPSILKHTNYRIFNWTIQENYINNNLEGKVCTNTKKKICEFKYQPSRISRRDYWPVENYKALSKIAHCKSWNSLSLYRWFFFCNHWYFIFYIMFLFNSYVFFFKCLKTLDYLSLCSLPPAPPSCSLTTHQACRAHIGSISVTSVTAPNPFSAAQQPFPTSPYPQTTTFFPPNITSVERFNLN